MMLKLPRINHMMTVTKDPASITFSRFWDQAMNSVEVAFNGTTSLSGELADLSSGVAHRDLPNSYTGDNLFYLPVNSMLGYLVQGTQVVGSQITGWTAATGTENMGAFNADDTRTVGGGYSQSEVQAIQNDLLAARQRIFALESAMRAHGLID